MTDVNNKHRRKVSILVSGSLPPPLGGMATYCQDYLRSPLSSEFDVTICRAVLIKSVFSTRSLLQFTSRAFNSIVVMLVWIAMLFVKHPDIAHVHTSSYTGFYVKSLLTLVSRILGVRTILHIHGAEFKEFYRNSGRVSRWLIRCLINANSVIIVLSEEWQEFFRSIGGSDDRIVALANSVYLPNAFENKKASLRPKVLFMSNFEKRKGIYQLVDVIERRPDLLEKCRFVLAGPRTHDWHVVAERIRRLNLSETVELPGSLVGELKDRAYKEADIYVLQSYAEGMPIGLLEALSYGLACITTPVGGIPSVIQSGQNGILIEPGDSDALANALELLVCEQDLCRHLGNEARTTAEQKYNWVARAEEIKLLYLRLVPSASNQPNI